MALTIAGSEGFLFDKVSVALDAEIGMLANRASFLAEGKAKILALGIRKLPIVRSIVFPSLPTSFAPLISTSGFSAKPAKKIFAAATLLWSTVPINKARAGN